MVVGNDALTSGERMMDEWIAENCACGTNNQGAWDEQLFEEAGCDCAYRFEELGAQSWKIY